MRALRPFMSVASGVLLLAALTLSASQAHAGPAPSLLVPRFDLVQTAPPDQRYDQKADHARIRLITRRVRAAFGASKHYRVLDRGPKDRRPPYAYTGCHACIYDWARARGADYVLVGWVQKESRLILFISMALLNVHSHKVVQTGSVSLRGDTDSVWIHGARYLLEHTFHVIPTPHAPAQPSQGD
ncbi:MAG TPA: DUF3280 domain-containing protein [Gammaproteobacteria bacterium]|nr:DUF3280 domain-containing protein [Gammaproteobacteria bacterium]